MPDGTESSTGIGASKFLIDCADVSAGQPEVVTEDTVRIRPERRPVHELNIQCLAVVVRQDSRRQFEFESGFVLGFNFEVAGPVLGKISSDNQFDFVQRPYFPDTGVFLVVRPGHEDRGHRHMLLQLKKVRNLQHVRGLLSRQKAIAVFLEVTTRRIQLRIRGVAG